MATSCSRGRGGAGPWLDPGTAPPFVGRRRLAGAAFALGLITAMVVAGYAARSWIGVHVDGAVIAGDNDIVSRLAVLAVGAYILIMAAPFVPGIEIGLGLLMVFGSKIAAVVYLCTVASLGLSFAIGRLIPESALAGLLSGLHLHKASRLVARFECLNTDERWRVLLTRTPRRLHPLLSRYRYLVILIVFNLPGNIVLGGGGGIAMMMGMSRLFPAPVFLPLVALAVLPVPLACLLLGFPSGVYSNRG